MRIGGRLLQREIDWVFNILGALNFFRPTEATLDGLFKNATELRLVEPQNQLVATLSPPQLHEIRPLLRLTGSVGPQCMCRHGSLALEFFRDQHKLATLQYIHEKSLRHSSYPGQSQLADGPALSRWLLENDILCSVGEANKAQRDYKLWVQSAPEALRADIEHWVQPAAFEQAEELLANNLPDERERSRRLLAWIGVVEKFSDHARYLRLATRMLMRIPEDAVIAASQKMENQPALLRGVGRYWLREGAAREQLPFSTLTALERAQFYGFRDTPRNGCSAIPREWRVLAEGGYSQLQIGRRGLLVADGQDIVNICLDSGARDLIHPGNEVDFQFTLGEDGDLMITQPSGDVFHKSNLAYDRNFTYWFGPERMARRQRHPYGPVSTSDFKVWLCQDGTIWRWIKGYDVRLERAKFHKLHTGSALPRLLCGSGKQLIWSEGRKLWCARSGRAPEQIDAFEFEPAALAIAQGAPVVLSPSGTLYFQGKSGQLSARPLSMCCDSEGCYVLTQDEEWKVEMWPYEGAAKMIATCPKGRGAPSMALSPDCIYLSDGGQIRVHPR